jgi:hypothetical protein
LVRKCVKRIHMQFDALKLIFRLALLVVSCTLAACTSISQQQEIPISQVVDDVKVGKITKIIAHEDSNEILVCYDPACMERKLSIKEDAPIHRILMDFGISPDKIPLIEVQRGNGFGESTGFWLGFAAASALAVVIGIVSRRPK